MAGDRFLRTGGFTSSITDALKQTTSLDPFGVPLSDPLHRQTKAEYDANLNLVKLTDATNAVRNYTYEPVFNRLTSVTDPLGHITSFEYDGQGNLTATVDPLGNRTTIAYDGLGQATSVTDPLNNTTTFGYDTFGNLTTIRDPLGNTTTRTYDVAGHLIRQTDPAGKATAFSYDALNRIVAIVDALGGRTAFSYDGNGNLLTVTDARGNTTTYTYDSMDRVASRTDPAGATETFEYDTMGNLTRHVDRKGQVATFSYDALNRRTGAVYAESAVTYQYDAAGRLNIARDTANGLMTWGYDALDRVGIESGPLGSVTYGYDAGGRRTRMQAPGVAAVTYGYDAASRLTSVTQAPSSPATLTYDDAGRRTTLTLPNQVATAYQYDAASRLVGLTYTNTVGPLGDLTYQYDAAGNRVAVGGSFARTLLPEAVTSAGYDATNRQLAFGDATMTYDANGRLTTLADLSGLSHVVWDARGQLASMTASGTSAGFSYDVLGRRTDRRLGADHTSYIYDGLDVVDEFSTVSEQSYVRTLAVDEPLSRGNGEFYLIDSLGSVVALTNHDGSLASTYTYGPFGATAINGESGNPFQFSGRESDAPTALYYYRARYYSPTLLRFIGEDPIDFVRIGINQYAYAGNAPTRFTDPLGLVTTGYQLINVSAGAGGGASGTLSVVSDDHGQIGLSITGGAGSYGGIGASVTTGAQFSTAATIQNLGGAGASTSVTVNSGPIIGPLAVVGEAGYFVGKGYQGGMTGVGLGIGTPVSITGFATGTRVICLFNCVSNTPGSAAVPPPQGQTRSPTCGRKC